MNKAFEKILERLEELQNNLLAQTEGDVNLQVGVINGVMYSKKIVKEVAGEYTSTEHINCSTDTSTNTSTNGWIPCSERLPEVGQIVLENVRKPSKYVNKGTPIIITEYEDVYYWRNGTILAWQPLPEPFKERD